ncbi:hypothetical protein [Geomicrobium sp. JCM 19037]|uniref:hypothetical protein n=1 Tax=Geomicrobium sp. JCM 19037 TaxID=1460634 RepID=UPI000693FBC0|nr:hypothetical protein [Geomicrobium sp. JCM 19037]
MTTAIVLSILIIVLLILLLINLDFRGGRADHHKKATTATRTNIRYGHPQLISDGRAFFEQLKTDIESASQTIHLSFFIWKEPGIGTELLNLLERRARDGVQVCILVDRLARPFPSPPFSACDILAFISPTSTLRDSRTCSIILTEGTTEKLGSLTKRSVISVVLTLAKNM